MMFMNADLERDWEVFFDDFECLIGCLLVAYFDGAGNMI
jgi:hypothetical protein